METMTKKLTPAEAAGKKIVKPANKPRFKREQTVEYKRHELELFICSRFKLLRQDAFITQKKMAEMLGLTESYIKGIEQGRFTPAIPVIYLAAQLFNKDINWFFGYKAS